MKISCLSIAVLVGQLAISTDAFAPQSRPALHQVKRSPLVQPSTFLHSTLSDKETDQRPFLTTEDSSDNEPTNCLELDSVGRLRLCNRPDVLLQGLDPKVWSATRPVSGKTNSLFLHTSHPESLPEHQTSLGSLISCRRLIACASKYHCDCCRIGIPVG